MFRTSSRESIDITPYLQYFIDTSNQLTFDEVKAINHDQFSSIGIEKFKRPIHRNITIWMILKVMNRSPEDYYLGIHFPKTYAFIPDSTRNFHTIILGTQDPATRRDDPFSLPFLTIAPGFDSSIYFKLKPKNFYSLGNPNQRKFDFTINSGTGIKKAVNRSDGNLIVLGILLTVCFYHLILFLFNADKSYLYLGIFASIYVLQQIFYTGLLESWFSIPYSFHYSAGVNAIIFAFWPIVMPFTIKYLDLKKQNPIWHFLLSTIGWYLFSFYVIVFFVQFLAPNFILYTRYGDVLMFNAILVATGANLILLIAGLKSYQKGHKIALYFILAFSVLVSNTMWNLITSNYNSFFNGIAFLLLSFGLARQFKSLQDQRSKAEKQKAISDQLRKIEVQEKEKLKELDQFKTQLYTNITHEFRTPLTVISGIADQIQNQPQEKELIQRNSIQLLDLVNQMLELSKIDSGFLKPQWVQSDIIPQIKYLSESYQHLASSQDKQFNLQILEESIWTDTDPQMLERILNNLVHNAIKFTPAGGKVQLRVAGDPNHDRYLLSVKDTGRGIPEEQLDKIFDRFYQVDHSNTRQGEGTGIGLALVKELTELLQGKISVESKLYQGTEFTIKFPIRQKAEIKTWTPRSESKHNLEFSHSPKQLQSPNGDQPKVLIIEDHPDVRTYLKKLLINDYHLLEANNGKTGLSMAMEEVPDLIISDIMMPELDGLSLCQQIKRDARTSHIPVILLTAKSTQDDRLQGLEEGADAYLTKPFDKRELFIRIEKLLETREKMRSHYHQFQMLPQEKVQENSFLNQVRKHIENNFSNEQYQIDDLSSHLHLSRTQVYRKLKALTGKTFTDIVKEMKIHRAKELLSKTEKNVSEIAYDLGFKDASYFGKVFKESTGSNPSHSKFFK
ncbi:MAG: response regulator [Saprospiraceae bacterium]|nr:response regulator [Saprospiraceae bacterium]